MSRSAGSDASPHIATSARRLCFLIAPRAPQLNASSFSQRLIRRALVGVLPRSISETWRRRIEGQEVSHVSIDIQFGNFVKMFFLLLKLALLDGSAVLQHGNQVLPKKFLDQFLNIRLNPFA